MSALAETHMKKGQWKEAEELYLQVVEAKKTVCHPEETDTYRSLADLASAYMAQGRWKESEQLQAHVVDGFMRAFGIRDEETLKNVDNLALAYKNLGSWAKAKELYVQLERQRKEAHGKMHTDTLGSTLNLGLVLMHQGMEEDAQEKVHFVIITLDGILGRPDDNTWAPKVSVYEELCIQVLETAKQVFGDEDPETTMAANTLANIYAYRGQWKETETLCAEILKVAERTREDWEEDDMAMIFQIQRKLGLAYRNQGRLKEALFVHIQVYKMGCMVWGNEHDFTMSSMRRLAEIHQLLGQWAVAEEAQRYVMGFERKVYGDARYDTIVALAATFRGQGKWLEAEKLHLDILQWATKTHGVQHRVTLDSFWRLMSLYKAQGRSKDMENLEQEFLEARRRIMGSSHPKTLKEMGCNT